MSKAQDQPGLQSEASLYFKEAKTRLFWESCFHKTAACSNDKGRSRAPALELEMVARAENPSTWDNEARRSVLNQPGLHNLSFLKSKQKYTADFCRRMVGFKHCFFSPLIYCRFWVVRAMCTVTLVEVREQPAQVGSPCPPSPRAGIQIVSLVCKCLRSRGLQNVELLRAVA